jgi:hypothetical protein
VWVLWSLAVEWPDWNLPWAGIGAFMAGLGSLLSGIAAYRIARRRNDHEPEARGRDRKR